MELTAQRFAQALFVLEEGLLDEVVTAAKSRTVSGLLTSVVLGGAGTCGGTVAARGRRYRRVSSFVN